MRGLRKNRVSGSRGSDTRHSRRRSGAVGRRGRGLRWGRGLTVLLVLLAPAVLLVLLRLPAPRDALLPLIHPRDADWGRRGDRVAMDRRQAFIDRGPGSAIEEPLLARLRPRSEGGRWVHEVPLRLTPPTNAARPFAVAFHFLQPTQPVSFRSAELVAGTNRIRSLRSDFERFEVRPRFVEHVIEFPWPPGPVGRSGDVWTLRVVTDEYDVLHLWTRGLTPEESTLTSGWFALADRPMLETLPEEIHGWISFTQSRSNSLAHVLPEGHVRMESPVPVVSRLAVLAWVWGFRTPSALGLWLGVACGVLAAGILAWPGTRGSRRFVLRVGLSAGGILLGLASIYTVLVPPFQAPDEPEHYISFAKDKGSRELIPAGRRLAARAQLERMVFRPDQKLRPDHLYHSNGGWTDSVETVPSRPARSGLGFQYWHGLWSLFQRMNPEDTLLRLRMANSMVAAVCLGLAAALLARAERDPRAGRSAGFLWLTIPTLPFFTLFFSNYSAYLSASILASGALVATVFGRRRDPLTGFLLGTSLGCLLHVSRGSITFVATVVIVLCVDAVLPVLERGSDRRSALPMRLAMAVGLVLPRWLTTDEYDQFMGAEIGALIPAWGGLPFGSLYLIAIEVGTAVLSMADVLGSRTSAQPSGETAPGDRGRDRKGRIVRIWPSVVVTVLLCSLIPAAETPVVEFVNPVPSGRYALQGLAAWFGSFGVTHQEFAASRTFWSGFGWLEFSLPTALTVAPALLWVVGWCLGVSGRTGSGPVWLGSVRAILVGLAIVLGLLGVIVAAHQSGYSVRGRYLFPMNMLVCGFAGVWLSRGLAARLPAGKGLDRLVVLGPVLVIHLATLGCLLARYF